MTILTSKTQLGGAVNDTFTDSLGNNFILIRVDADGQYIWREISVDNGAIKVDSSVGVTTETLSASTNSGLVKLYINIDVTNTATLSVQTGETLNGITDGTFLFSNYSAGTQFRADEVTGGWVISVVGAIQQTSLNEGQVNLNSNQTITSISLTPTAGFVIAEWTVDKAGFYDLKGQASFQHTALEQGDNSQSSAALAVIPANGNPSYIIPDTQQAILKYGQNYTGTQFFGAPITTEAKIQLEVGDVVRFIASRNGTVYQLVVLGSSNYGAYLRYDERPTTESVLAGMVTPQPWLFETATINPQTLVFGGTPALLTGSQITVPAGKFKVFYDVFLGLLGATANQRQLQFEVWNTTDNVLLKELSFRRFAEWGTNLRYNEQFRNNASFVYDFAVPTDIEIRGSTTDAELTGSVVDNGGDAISYIGYKTEPTSTVVINTTDIPVNQTGIVEGDLYEADGNGGFRKATPKYDTIVGTWTGTFAMNGNGHTTLNLGFDITECDYLDFTLYDDGPNWAWSGRVEGRAIELRPSNILIDREGTTYIWARTTGVNPAIGEMQFRDAGGVGMNIGQVVGYKRPTL